jgi:glucose-6-phosphate isomerase
MLGVNPFNQPGVEILQAQHVRTCSAKPGY